MTKLRPKYINSPSWKQGGKSLAGLLALYAFFFALTVGAILLTGGDR